MIDEVIAELYNVGVIKFGDFVLASGKRSPYYFDFRILPSYPKLYSKVIDLWVRTLLNTNIEFDGVVGVATAGIVHAAVLGYLLKKPIGYVRVDRKDHGTGKLVEGVLGGLNVIVIDDVATTGNSLIRAYQMLKGEGVNVTAFSVILDREEGADENLRNVGAPLIALMRSSQIFKTLKDLGLIGNDVYSTVVRYLGESR